MGIFDSLKNQFIEVIEWLDASNDTIAYRFPVANQEIKMNILTQKVRLLWEVVPRIAIDDDNIALPTPG